MLVLIAYDAKLSSEIEAARVTFKSPFQFELGLTCIIYAGAFFPQEGRRIQIFSGKNLVLLSFTLFTSCYSFLINFSK
jgi:hypothetical protein